MKIILSQRVDVESDYNDVPFSEYHFPKVYRSRITPGDRFIYYQGDRFKKEHRYYFGCGVMGRITPDYAGDYYYAKILEGKAFIRKIPIYHPDGGFFESLGYSNVREMANPSWRNSVRKISDEAFDAILISAGIETDYGLQASAIETSGDPLDVLRAMNEYYRGLPAVIRDQKIRQQVDRGTAVIAALKSILGAECQICEWQGFKKSHGGDFIEAHHLSALSMRHEGSLCTDNIILLCPNCHREIHY